jgi:hypothetical protein
LARFGRTDRWLVMELPHSCGDMLLARLAGQTLEKHVGERALAGGFL